MRNVALFAICAALSLAHASAAKSDAIQTPRMTSASFSSINAVAVVSLEALPREAQEQVYAASLRMSDDQLRALRLSIENLPAASEALKAGNLHSADVLAAVINGEGQLLLITAVVI
jgi:outer membrane protease